MLAVAKQCAKKAGTYILKYHGTLGFSLKNRDEVVTHVDKKSEEIIKKIILSKYPSHSILGEETGSHESDSPYQWIIDPIDGTRNYGKGIHYFCVSIGLMKDGIPYLGVIYDPYHDELFHAQTGKGAYLNRRQITASKQRDIKGFCMTFGEVHENQKALKLRKRLQGLRGLRSFGAGALELAYLASGRLDALIKLDTKVWDVAAGYVICREAGVKLTDIKGTPWSAQSRDILGANPLLHKKILSKIR